ncbi:MAG: hypothetical protein ACLFTJ_14500 [Halothece sp.]
MFNIYVSSQEFLQYADFKGKWEKQVPVEVWCEDLQEVKRPPRELSHCTIYVSKEAWLRLEGTPNWAVVRGIRIILEK